MSLTTPLLEIDSLSIDIREQSETQWTLLHNLSLSLNPGERVGLVGESGSGKTTLAYAILGLMSDNLMLNQGRIFWKQQDITQWHDHQYLNIRGKEISMIFQNPQACLLPSVKVGKQLKHLIKRHFPKERKIENQILGSLKTVNFQQPKVIAAKYPHELSGGMCQRIMIAMALLCQPSLIIADEPTSALDVVNQKKVLDLLKTACQQQHSGLIFISHDLLLAAQLCQRICVIHEGRIVEDSSPEMLFRQPRHKYTRQLLACLPHRI